MKILVIGGTGNISRWFVPSLIGNGDDVTLYNRGQHPVHFEGNYTTVIGDRTHHQKFKDQVRSLGTFDCVIDMVGFEPGEAAVAVDAFSGRTGQYIFCSTIDVYHKEPPAFPLTESDTAGPPSAAFKYGHKKWEMERTLWAASEAGGLPLTVIRPGATYSEGWSPLITCFGGQPYHLHRLKTGKQIILHGDGTGLWTATHSEDMARAFIGAVGNAAAVNKAYNVTGDELLSWETMHRTVAELMDAPAPDFLYIPTSLLYRMLPAQTEWCKENFQYSTVFDNTLAKKDLGFRYTVPFRQGAERCLAHLYRSGTITSDEDHAWYDALVENWKRLIEALI